MDFCHLVMSRQSAKDEDKLPSNVVSILLAVAGLLFGIL
jgi:hypothetical protein